MMPAVPFQLMSDSVNGVSVKIVRRFVERIKVWNGQDQILVFFSILVSSVKALVFSATCSSTLVQRTVSNIPSVNGK